MTSLAASSSNVPWLDTWSCSTENFNDGNSSIERVYSSNMELIHCGISRSPFNVIRANTLSLIIQELSPFCNKLIGFWLLINLKLLQDPTSVKNELNVSRNDRRAKYARTALQPRISHWLTKGDKVPSISYIFPLAVRILNILKGNAIPIQAWTGTEGSKRFRIPGFKTIGARKRSLYQP